MTDSRNNKGAQGHLHPLTQIVREIVDSFVAMGFEVADGPEVESEHYNFDVLNVPKDHPSRDMQDTFWLKPSEDGSPNHSTSGVGLKGVSQTVLRTHTSSVQARYMETQKPPFKIIVPGKVFRCEATDATHEAQFHQIEGLVVGEGISLSHLQYTLNEFFKRLYGTQATIRFRPSFFPFVEPGVEVDVSCVKCSGKGCGMCKQTGFIEVMGAGMVHPNVLTASGIDPQKYRGFAFGMGVDRLVMLKYGIDDIRYLYSGDLRLVNQF
ncbi:MAG: phenylalanine--tRNA ligase subunit alpha [Candidatus Yonathbacteria bacterium RBG_16_43_6]|uniref:phenylalanine--tRNA ligase n=1 Tax=Candidatus Yonathbacteria bacterium RIFCSPLOWO2_01_FULL_43_27 TaxID=1802726 RepID=A0A1G2SC67_9BACT|nr:MAG: phenylalanine--tRNA ligase subunit alpha [Candidatus Yonathbacteria bacterium RIFCSPHIGHO2_01_FULL_44_19]OHA80048.1 MAG: phenylalanine--tRNA ligase subunit alpha [Candidatus Yonathbacteria bacterium RBG_16_43_6]OHA82627.1 MAG: phenylalanine--tRNA ligase subunit alpha [Candidatus Yonathbacteria bacterium RIFCSPLOWO2_01_FULL_43_27]